jgi:osmotically-inducible protein OsmY
VNERPAESFPTVFKGSKAIVHQKNGGTNMNWNLNRRKALVVSLALAGATFLLPQASRAASAPDQQDVSSAVRSKLDKSQFKDIQVNVDANGVATLSGSVSLYEYKADADKTTHKVKGVVAVRNEIQVAGPSVSDSDLQKKLLEKLSYDRVGYGNVFDAVSVQVQNGVVTLGGHALDYPSKDSALALAATMPGVKDVVDEVAVDPVSPMDDQLRLQVARAVYSFPSLNKYAIDPAKPIRISVQNGNVALYGEVDSEADKDAAGIRANGVAGVFSVKNYLQVAGQQTEHHGN